jgi:hypothetical protein
LLVGHRWRPVEDVHEAYTFLRCRRCHRELEVTSEDVHIVPWTGRHPSAIGRITGERGPDGRPY